MSVESIRTISPTTNQPVCTRPGISPADLQQLPAAASEAFLSFRKTSLAERQAIVKKALKLLSDKQDVLAKELTEQMGRPIAYTGVEIATAVKRGEYLVKISGDALKDTDGEPEKGFKRFIRKVPVGPVLVLFAWNYPYLILVNSLIPAILAGNSVILKPSPQTPTIVEHISSVFTEAGLPKNVIQYFHSGSLVAIESIIQDPNISLICFTGSVAGGLAVQKSASERIINVGLELGGKDPAYVRSDVDVAWAAEEIVDGAVFNSGQSCCSIERVYVDEKIHDQFVEQLQRVLKGYKLGNPFDKETQVGPVISRRSQATIEAHIQDALDKGAVDATPDNESFKSPPPDGNFVKPTLVTNVDHSMLVMTEETFGPVIPVMKVKSDDEAVKLMNDSQFGLTASIWTKDTEKGAELAESVEAGTVFVNRCDFPSPDLAWTGWKNSGKGATLSRFGFDQFVKLKSFHLTDYPK
ncbi:putative Succinate-semialdehyde dehydrogenase [Venustampulla echinocandica]|uniref:aldehyde dehydrogenase (NAD(+)) n=1 Tax=Venustampulla echinocandica TaxID=2656787 RepID=A0A370TAE8_9HELO|nr:putative Succinate-semialdehyde dehydrogenase [Venustampulla echinocandica]RDL30779.1 putative Succinate-semialdehyde dehydrogenase [Venustampulla echinocandica]